jgi:hypothetical protein
MQLLLIQVGLSVDLAPADNGMVLSTQHMPGIANSENISSPIIDVDMLQPRSDRDGDTSAVINIDDADTSDGEERQKIGSAAQLEDRDGDGSAPHVRVEARSINLLVLMAILNCLFISAPLRRSDMINWSSISK